MMCIEFGVSYKIHQITKLKTTTKLKRYAVLTYCIVQVFDRGDGFWHILTFQIFDGKYFDGWSLSFTMHL